MGEVEGASVGRVEGWGEGVEAGRRGLAAVAEVDLGVGEKASVVSWW